MAKKRKSPWEMPEDTGPLVKNHLLYNCRRDLFARIELNYINARADDLETDPDSCVPWGKSAAKQAIGALLYLGVKATESETGRRALRGFGYMIYDLDDPDIEDVQVMLDALMDAIQEVED